MHWNIFCSFKILEDGGEVYPMAKGEIFVLNVDEEEQEKVNEYSQKYLTTARNIFFNHTIHKNT